MYFLVNSFLSSHSGWRTAEGWQKQQREWNFHFWNQDFSVIYNIVWQLNIWTKCISALNWKYVQIRETLPFMRMGYWCSYSSPILLLYPHPDNISPISRKSVKRKSWSMMRDEKFFFLFYLFLRSSLSSCKFQIKSCKKVNKVLLIGGTYLTSVAY